MILGGRQAQVYLIKAKIYTIHGTVFRHKETLYEFDTKKICLMNSHVDNLGLTAGNLIVLTGKTHD
jgi:hypothetical protein